MEQKAVFDRYAIFQVGSKQYQALEGKTVALDRLKGQAGEPVVFSEVLLRKASPQEVTVGQPFVESPVRATIVKHLRGPKLVVFKFKRRKKYRVKKGHRSELTVVRIESI